MNANKMHKRVDFICEDYILGGDVIRRAIQEVRVLDEKGRIVKSFKTGEYTSIDQDELSLAVFEEVPEFKVNRFEEMKYRGEVIATNIGFTSITLGAYYKESTIRERITDILQALEKWIDIVDSFRVSETTISITAD